MAQPSSKSQKSGLIGSFKQAEGPSFSSLIKDVFSGDHSKSVNSGLLKTLESSHKMQTETFNSAAHNVMAISKNSPEVAIESIHAIERMHESALLAQRQESRDTRKFLMFATLVAMGGTACGVALYANKQKQAFQIPSSSSVSSRKLTALKITKD